MLSSIGEVGYLQVLVNQSASHRLATRMHFMSLMIVNIASSAECSQSTLAKVSVN